VLIASKKLVPRLASDGSLLTAYYFPSGLMTPVSGLFSLLTAHFLLYIGRFYLFLTPKSYIPYPLTIAVFLWVMSNTTPNFPTIPHDYEKSQKVHPIARNLLQNKHLRKQRPIAHRETLLTTCQSVTYNRKNPDLALIDPVTFC
jgi:hypothetical protein